MVSTVETFNMLLGYCKKIMGDLNMAVIVFFTIKTSVVGTVGCVCLIVRGIVMPHRSRHRIKYYRKPYKSSQKPSIANSIRFNDSRTYYISLAIDPKNSSRSKFGKNLNKFYSRKLNYFTVQNLFIVDIPLFLGKHRPQALEAKTQFKHTEL